MGRAEKDNSENNFSRGRSSFPSPLVGEGGRDAEHRGRVRGLSPRIEPPHPSRTSSVPPSPTRGEGKKGQVLLRLGAARGAVAHQAVEMHANVGGFGGCVGE